MTDERQTARRASLPRMPWKNPVLLSTSAFGATAFFVLTALAVHRSWRDWTSVILWISAIVFALAGLLVLSRSTAIRRINSAQRRNKYLLDELSRADLYSEQIHDTLSAAVDFWQRDDAKDTMNLLKQVMDTLVTRASAVFESQVRAYLVHTTTSWHIVKHVAGPAEPFGIAPGKMCSAERSLAEALDSLGQHWYRVSVCLEGTSHSLVLLTGEPIRKADRLLLEETAGVFNLLDDHGSHRSGELRHLHAVV